MKKIKIIKTFKTIKMVADNSANSHRPRLRRYPTS